MRKTEEEIVGGLSGKGRRLINSHIFVENLYEVWTIYQKNIDATQGKKKKNGEAKLKNENHDQITNYGQVLKRAHI